MLGGGGLGAELLPRNIDRIAVISWQLVDGDPNHGRAPQGHEVAGPTDQTFSGSVRSQ